MSFAISSVARAQNIPAESPPQAAIRRENDTQWCDAFHQQNFASSPQAGMGSHPTVAETSKSLAFQVEADWPKVLTTAA
jgi:hypothetical protein